jgi:hypothetical protein
VDDIPVNRLQVLARTGLGSKASALARLGEPKRAATLVAVVRHLEAAAVDDTLDLFALLMATRLFSPARRTSAGQRLAMLPRLEKASKTVARAGRVLLDRLAAAEVSGDRLEVATLWAAVKRIASRAAVVDAITLVEELVPDDDGSADSAMRAALAGRYNTVRPFLALLGESAALHAAPGGERVLAAVRGLPELARRRVTQKPLTAAEIDAELVTPAWARAVYANAGLPAGAVDRDAYVVCVLEGLHRARGGATCTPGPRIAGLTRGACCSTVTGGRRSARTCWLGSVSPIRRRCSWPVSWSRWTRRGSRLRPALGRPARMRGLVSWPARTGEPGWSWTTSTRSANPTAWSGCGRWRRRCCRASTCPNCFWRCTPGPGSWTPTPTSTRTKDRVSAWKYTIVGFMAQDSYSYGDPQSS